MAKIATDELEGLIERIRLKGAVPSYEVTRVVEVLEEYLEERRAYSPEKVKARHPDGVKLSELVARVKDLKLPKGAVSDAIVEIGIGRWAPTPNGTRILFNYWEHAYVASAAYYPGLLTAEGADAVEAFLRTGKRPKIRGEPK